jgi:hypothetical protein
LSTTHATRKAMKNQISDRLIFRSTSATSSFAGSSPSSLYRLYNR